MVRSFLLAVTALFTLAACASADTTASAEAPAGRDCFNADSVNGFSPIDDNHVKITVGVNRHYSFATAPRITEARFNERIGIRSTTNWICTGNGLGVSLIVPEGIPDRYQVTEIVRLPEEAPAAAEAAPQGS